MVKKAAAAAVAATAVPAVPASGPSSPSSLVRMLAVLDLFSESAPAWSVEEVAEALGYTRSTAYRYVGELAEAGLLVAAQSGWYSLGPRILRLDRQLRDSDPMLAAFLRIEPDLRRLAREQTWLLCRMFRDTVICIHQSGSLATNISFSRGFPMPLFRGATSKAMLAFLPDRQLMRLYLANQADVAAAGLGADWKAFKTALRDIRRDGYVASVSEVDRGVYGIAAPVFDPDGRVIGSISCVRPVTAMDRARWTREGEAMMETAAAISQGMVDALAKANKGKGRSAARSSGKGRGGPASRTAARPAA
jgi:DNA-binding IclR family transcriptional regulator